MTVPETLVIGEALVDIVHKPDGEVVPLVGGSPLNVAIGLARLGAPARLASWIAEDDYGQMIADHLMQDRVVLVEGSVAAARTPTATATLDQNGTAAYEFDIDWQLPMELPTEVGHVHTGSIAAVLQPGASAVRDALFAARGRATISLDPNTRPSLMGDPADVRADLEQLIGLADVVKASDEDIRWLYGEDVDLETVLRLWAGLCPSVTIATRGGSGALVYVASDGVVLDVPGVVVDVVDSVGAGDSFMAGALSAMLDAGLLGSPQARERLMAADSAQILPCIERAVRAAGITVSRAGANPPTRADLGI